MAIVPLGMARPIIEPPPQPPLGCATSCDVLYGWGSESDYADTWVRDEGQYQHFTFEEWGSQFSLIVKYDVSNQVYKKLTIDAQLLNWGVPAGNKLHWKVHYTNGFIEDLYPLNGGDTIHLLWGGWGCTVDYIALNSQYSGSGFPLLTANVDFVKFYLTI